MNADIAIFISIALLIFTVIAWIKFVVTNELNESKSTILSTRASSRKSGALPKNNRGDGKAALSIFR